MRLAVSSEAELEIFEAALRYERERAGLGLRLETEVNAVFERILQNPLQFPEIDQGARRALVRRFPYGVFFYSGTRHRHDPRRPEFVSGSGYMEKARLEADIVIAA